jgi:hypothetical protein
LDLQVVEMAALLFLGDLDGAKHLWKRSTEVVTMEQPLLTDWWKVAVGMITNHPEALWSSLQHIANHHPAPINGYAAVVATAYRKKLLHGITDNIQLATMPPLSKLLNFASVQELQQFVAEHGVGNTPHTVPSTFVDKKTSVLQVVSFLETAKLVNMATLSGKANKVEPEILA